MYCDYKFNYIEEDSNGIAASVGFYEGNYVLVKAGTVYIRTQKLSKTDYKFSVQTFPELQKAVNNIMATDYPNLTPIPEQK